MLILGFVLSLLTHGTGAVMYGFLAARMPRLIPHPQPTEMFVTLSEAFTLGKRPHPRPHTLSRPRTPPRKPVVVLPLSDASTIAPPIRRRRTLPPRPMRVHLPKLAHVTPTRPEPARSTEAARASRLSQTQIERLTNDFARTIASARRAENPLRVAQATPAATVKRYRLQFEGRISALRAGQGLLTSIKRWFADGYTYYYVTYEVVWPDGTYESGAVPWPIRYLPAEDPFASGISRRIPLPPPLPGWNVPAGMRLGKVLREYFPQRHGPAG
jgi:hypothetical protein